MPSPSPDEVLAALQQIFQSVLDNKAVQITPDSSALNTPGWDSLAHIEIIEMVERRFKAA